MKKDLSAKSEAVNGSNTISSNQPIILLVDDSESIRKLLAINLKRQGYRVLMAPNGHIALQALKKYPQIKAIVLDMMMPIMNGPNFIKYSRQLGFTDIPIVVLTGMNDFSLPERMERLKKAGVRKVLTKPVDLHLLNTTLHDALAVGE